MDKRGYFSDFGGAYLPEILVATFDELAEAFEQAKADPSFWQAYEPSWGPTPAGRPRSRRPRT